MFMRPVSSLILSLLLSTLLFCASAFAADKVISMSTTTSTQASGLLDVLLPELEKDTGITVKVIAKGTGAAIRDGMDGNVDVIFVHAKSREEKFVAEGYGSKRFAVMHNDFVLLGPKDDPAGIMGMKDVRKAMKKVATSGEAFVSRGDDSGTHTKEQELWRLTKIPLVEKSQDIVKKGKTKTVTAMHPAEGNYLSIGQGMGKTITFTEEKQAYVLADRGTYLKFKYGRTQGLDLDIMVEGDGLLHNPYGIIPVSPEKHPHVKKAVAQEFVDWLVGPKGQALIANYKLLGRQLFYPDALPDAR
jgi:tungstate transport system substrate-binding protein